MAVENQLFIIDPAKGFMLHVDASDHSVALAVTQVNDNRVE